MLRQTLVAPSEPMLSSAGANPLALGTEWKQSSDDRPPCLENPRPEGAESTLTENAASPFHAEPRHLRYETTIERQLGRSVDRLEQLPRRRKGEMLLPPVSVRLTRG